MNQQVTRATKESDVERAWHLIDVNDQVLGRVASQIAQLLMGKGKSYFVRHLDVGDYVVVVNAEKIRVTGKKNEQKVYFRYSGYPGGLRKRTLREQRELRPTEVVMHAVKGMLPQNRLRDRMLRRLKIFVGPEHRFADKFRAKEVSN